MPFAMSPRRHRGSRAGLIVTSWLQGTSRDGDPQDHIARLLPDVDIAPIDDSLGRRAEMLLARTRHADAGPAGPTCRDEANGNLSRLPDYRDCLRARATPVYTADADVINKIFI